MSTRLQSTQSLNVHPVSRCATALPFHSKLHTQQDHLTKQYTQCPTGFLLSPNGRRSPCVCKVTLSLAVFFCCFFFVAIRLHSGNQNNNNDSIFSFHAYIHLFAGHFCSKLYASEADNIHHKHAAVMGPNYLQAVLD